MVCLLSLEADHSRRFPSVKKLIATRLEWVTNLEFSRFADSKNESEKKDDEIIAAQNAADRHLAGLG